MSLRYDGKVVVVTGAGGDLGRQYALLFASRGAKVLVNDLGTSPEGQGKAQGPADKVVEQIKSKGGIAIANYDSVQQGEKIIKAAIDHFGRIDVLVNNAGIARPGSFQLFQKIKSEDWQYIFKIHVEGTFRCSKAAWIVMKQQGYGRIINTSSPAGLYKIFGQANYSSAKLATHGITQSLAAESDKRNVMVNTIAPLAASRLLELIVKGKFLKLVSPSSVSPLVAYLAHQSCTENGGLFEVGGGYISKVRWQRTEGVFINPSTMTPQSVAQQWKNITSFEGKNENPSVPDDTFRKISALHRKAKL